MSLKKCNITYFSPSVAMMYFQSRLMIILTLGPTSHSLASQATGSLFSLSLLHIFWRIGAQLKKTKLVVVEQKRTSLSVCNSYSEWAKILKLSIRFNWTQLDSKRLSWTQRDATLLSPLTLCSHSLSHYFSIYNPLCVCTIESTKSFRVGEKGKQSRHSRKI